MSNLTSASGEASATSSSNHRRPPQPAKKKRNQPGNPDPEAEVIALSPKTLMATNRFVCEICSKGFQRDQNLQLHKRGHNLPWKLKQRNNKEIRKKVYVCPEAGCVHNDPARALGDLTGIKKHFCRKHGEKKWKCDRCSKKYAVQSDWKAHSKTCGTREYRCDCGTLFSRRDSFITHRAFCDALAEESARASTSSSHQFSLKKEPPPPQLPASNFSLPPWLPFPPLAPPPPLAAHQDFPQTQPFAALPEPDCPNSKPNPNPHTHQNYPQPYSFSSGISASVPVPSAAHMSATALLQKAAQMGTMPASVTSQPPCPSSSSSLAAGRRHHSANINNASADVGGSRRSSSNSNSGLSLQGAAAMTGSSGFVHGLSSQGNKAASPGKGAGCPPPLSAALLRDAVMISTSFPISEAAGFAVSNFGGNSHNNAALLGMEREGGGGSGLGGEELTRDFLGLRPLSHSDIMSIAGLGGCMDTTRPHHASTQEEPWQG